MPEDEVHIAVALDFGLKRIGLASGNSLTRSASPLNAVAVHADGPDWSALRREFAALCPAIAVVGAPCNVDGSANAMSARAHAFALEVEARLGVPVVEVDERYSSLEAEGRLAERRADGRMRRRVARGDIDSAAAAVILERWWAQNR